MSTMNLENAQLFNVLANALKLESATRVLAGATTLVDADATIQRLDPGGAARDVTLPATTRANRGRVFIIFNDADAAENLVMKQSNGSTTVITIGQGKCGIVFNDGSGSATASWMGLLGS